MQLSVKIRVIPVAEISKYVPGTYFLSPDKLGELGKTFFAGYGLITRKEKCKPTSIRAEKKIIVIEGSKQEWHEWVLVQKVAQPYQKCPIFEIGLFCAENLVNSPTQMLCVVGAGIIVDNVLVCCDTARTPRELKASLPEEFTFNKDLSRYIELLDKFDHSVIDWEKDKVVTERKSRQVAKNYLVKSVLRNRKPFTIEQFENRLSYVFEHLVKEEPKADKPTQESKQEQPATDVTELI